MNVRCILCLFFLIRRRRRHISLTLSQSTSCLLIDMDTVVQERRRENTRKQYESSVSKLPEWIKKCYNDFYDEAACSVLLPSHADVLGKFLGHVAMKVDKESGEYLDPNQYNSFSQVNGQYNIVDYYEASNIQMDQDSVKTTSEFDADIKESGEMAMREGRSPMGVIGYKLLANEVLQQSDDNFFLVRRKAIKKAILQHVYANPMNPTVFVQFLALLSFFSALVFIEKGALD